MFVLRIHPVPFGGQEQNAMEEPLGQLGKL
jgi:hypothetical protein